MVFLKWPKQQQDLIRVALDLIFQIQPRPGLLQLGHKIEQTLLLLLPQLAFSNPGVPETATNFVEMIYIQLSS